MAWIRNFGRAKQEVAVRPITTPNKVVDSKQEDLPFGTASADTKAPASSQWPDAAKAAQNRMVPLGEKRPIGKDQWRKIKETAKESESCEANIEHWQSKSAGALPGTSFNEGGAADGGDAKQRKRPSMVTQARITSSRLQALQSRMEKPANDVDKMDEEDSTPRGH
ncbi:MAG: hypothetical protein KGS72_07155 [Cyanobacteria bacterium REEB67]|nr:hypothetical protein [Cyanobacteria bacterium REEB67]